MPRLGLVVQITLEEGVAPVSVLLLNAVALYVLLCVVALLQYSSSLLALLKPSISDRFQKPC